MSDEEIRNRIAHLMPVHHKEIGARAGEFVDVLRELLAARKELARLRAVIAESGQQLEASELPFYRGMELLRKEAV